MKLILASASPRRADLLHSAGLEFEVRPADINETPFPDEGPGDMVCRLSAEKAEAVAVIFPEATILAADTVVVLDGVALGKPADAADAFRMLKALSGRGHEVMTGFTIIQPGQKRYTECVCTKVIFRNLMDFEMESYVASGEPMDKAGAYGIQSGAAGFVSAIEGSYTNVVGLPLAQVMARLSRLNA